MLFSVLSGFPEFFFFSLLMSQIHKYSDWSYNTYHPHITWIRNNQIHQNEKKVNVWHETKRNFIIYEFFLDTSQVLTKEGFGEKSTWRLEIFRNKYRRYANNNLQKDVKKKIKCKTLDYLLKPRNKRERKGMEIMYPKFSDDIDITNKERKFIFQMKAKYSSKIKTLF